jgi:hypothetical protein
MVAWFFKDYALLEVTRPKEVAADLTFLTDFYLILLVIYGKCTKCGFFYTYCRCKSINGHRFPIPHLSRRSDKRVEMGHRPRRRRSPLILSHLDVHTIRRGEGVQIDICTNGWTYVWTYMCTDKQMEWTSVCDEMKGLCPLWGRCPKKSKVKREKSGFKPY